MKKLLSAILISAMLLTLLPCTVFGANSAELEEAILSAKSRIEIPEEYSEFSSDSYTDYGETVYNLRWYTPGDEYSYEKSIRISINNHGDIINYDNYDRNSYSSEPHFSNYAEEEIKSIAKNWLFSVNSAWEKSLPDEKIIVNGVKAVYDTSIYVIFHRIENNLPFSSDYATVCVNSLTGMVTSMNASWTYTNEIPSANLAMSSKEAEDIFFEKSPLELSYTDSENGAVLVYSPKNGQVVIDARTGEEFTFFRYGYSSQNAAAETASADEAMAGGTSNARLTESEIKNIAEFEKLLSQEELCSIAENLKNTNIKGLTLISADYNQIKDKKGETTEYTAMLYYENTSENGYGGAYITLDAETGELKSFSAYNEENNEKPKVSYEKAVKTAEEFINNYGGEAASKVKNNSVSPVNTEDIYSYALRFNRYENNVPYTSNGISVRIDPVSGYVTSYHKTWNDDITFEAPEDILSAEDARSKLMEQTDMILAYELQQGESKTEPVIGMTYTLNPQIPDTISAKSGKLLTYNGEIYDPNEDETRYPTDISGHYAETAINKLFEAGLLTLNADESTFRPDEPITQKDFIAFIYGLRSGYIPYPIDDDTLARTVRNLELTDIQIEPESPVSRELGVKLIVTVLDYDKAAELLGIFKTAFLDENEISPDTFGYIAIAQGLKIISGNGNGYFKPQEHLTRADAAIMIYNYLAR